jgi:hypothetical protein
MEDSGEKPSKYSRYAEYNRTYAQKYYHEHKEKLIAYRISLQKKHREEDIERVRALKREQQHRFYAKKREQKKQAAMIASTQ